jgi:beta-galactosidase
MHQSIGGQEKFHGALISHAGHENTRIFQECAQLGAELEKIGARTIQATTDSKIAIIVDWPSWWALENSSGPNKDIKFQLHAASYYKALHSRNIPVDVISKTADFSKYEIIIAPMLYMVNENDGQNLQTFVKDGGTLVGTTMTGLVDENDRCIYGEYPGLLREIFGIWVEETDALYPDERNHIMYDDKMYDCTLLCDLITLRGATALGTFAEDFYAARPAITSNQYGKGKGCYIATQPDDSFLSHFLKQLCAEKSITPPFPADPGVELTVRTSEKGQTIFAINHTSVDKTIDLKNETYTNILTSEKHTRTTTIKPWDVMVLIPS